MAGIGLLYICMDF